MFLLDMALFILACGLIGVWANHRKAEALRQAPAGSRRIESTKAHRANRTVQQYAACGWSVESQSSAKSFGSEPRVTLVFRKGRHA